MSISQSSLDIRLQKLICCIGTLAGEVADQMYIGGCYKEKLKKLKLLTGFLEALECYSITATDNCLTEEQVLNMFETVSEYCDICYPASDYQFTDSTIASVSQRLRTFDGTFAFTFN